MATPTLRRAQPGFTFIELIMVVVLVGIMAALGSSMISDSFATSRLVNSQDKSADEARYALERVARELREVKWDAVGSAYSISSALTAGTSTISFTRTISGTDVTVTLAKTGTNLTLAYSSPAVTSTLASGVGTFTLNFLQLDNSATTQASAVRFVVITLAMTDPTSGQIVTQRTRVALRNA